MGGGWTMVNDSLEAYGTVRVIKRNVKGEVIHDQLFKNQITNYARSQAAIAWGQSFSGVPVVFPSMIAVGTGAPSSGQSGTTPNDTSLWSELSGTRKTVDYAQQWLNYYIQYSVTYQPTEAQGSLTEAGLFDANGNLWSHVQLNGVTHDSTSTLSIQWQVLMKGN